jgi:hypothetical protein
VAHGASGCYREAAIHCQRAPVYVISDSVLLAEK